MAEIAVLPSLESVKGKLEQNGFPFAGLPNDRNDSLWVERITANCLYRNGSWNLFTRSFMKLTSHNNASEWTKISPNILRGDVSRSLNTWPSLATHKRLLSLLSKNRKKVIVVTAYRLPYHLFCCVVFLRKFRLNLLTISYYNPYPNWIFENLCRYIMFGRNNWYDIDKRESTLKFATDLLYIWSCLNLM